MKVKQCGAIGHKEGMKKKKKKPMSMTAWKRNRAAETEGWKKKCSGKGNKDISVTFDGHYGTTKSSDKDEKEEIVISCIASAEIYCYYLFLKLLQSRFIASVAFIRYLAIISCVASVEIASDEIIPLMLLFHVSQIFLVYMLLFPFSWWLWYYLYFFSILLFV